MKRPTFRRLRLSSLLTRFSAMTLVSLLLLGAGLGHLLEERIESRALASARDSAVLVARAGIQANLTPVEIRNGFSTARLDELDERLHVDSFGEAGIERVKLFNAEPAIIYSDDRSAIGRSAADSDKIRRALAGQVVTAFVDGVDHSGEGSRTLEVMVPLRFGSPDAVPAGVYELYLPYAGTEAAIAADVRAMYAALAGGLALLYFALYRIVAVASRRLRHQATHDALTGLPNRNVLLDRIGQALAAAGRNHSEVAVMLIDLDRFKEINDTLGHSYGDELLRQIGPRMRAVLRPADTVARLGGDEFAVLLPQVSGRDGVAEVAGRLRDALHQSFVADGMTLDVEASIGIALAPHHGDDIDALMRNADLAMYVAKEEKAGAVFFEPEVHSTAPMYLTLLGDLRRALTTGDELELHYQPKYALDDETLYGAEALLRWRHPVRGNVPPDEFIQVAESTGLIVPLTEWVLRRSLHQARAWMLLGHEIAVAVNLSTRCLLDSSLPGLVERLLREQEVPARLLRLEITESAVMGDAARSLDVLRRLHDLGVQLSIDDFGVGYTSMAWLRRLPVNELKVDRSFINGMTGLEQDAVLVRSAIDLGHNLGMTVVAEGVETSDQVSELRALGCDVAQGFHYARPMPAEEMTWLLGRLSEPVADRPASAPSPNA